MRLDADEDRVVIGGKAWTNPRRAGAWPRWSPDRGTTSQERQRAPQSPGVAADRSVRSKRRPDRTDAKLSTPRIFARPTSSTTMSERALPHRLHRRL